MEMEKQLVLGDVDEENERRNDPMRRISVLLLFNLR